jgi:hypothetical protein
MEILSSGEPVNLTNREADLAMRVVYDPQRPAAQSSRPEGTGAVRRCLHVPRPPCRVARGST